MDESNAAEETTERTRPTAEERALYRHMAKALWKAQKGRELPKNRAERQKLWEVDKKTTMNVARRMARHLQRSGVILTAPAEEPAD